MIAHWQISFGLKGFEAQSRKVMQITNKCIGN